MIANFKLQYKENFKILHITDPQIIDSSQMRFPTRLSDHEREIWDPSKMDKVCLNMIDDLVNRTKPDLILIEGDVIYGSFDDKGTSLELLMKRMSSYKIPFSLVFGNHDNECVKGREWQTKTIQKAEYSMFKNDVCSIGLYDGDNLKRIIIMLDTNGCWDASEQSLLDGCNRYACITEKQIKLLNELKEKVISKYGKMVPTTICQHIQSLDMIQFYKDNNMVVDPFIPYFAKNDSEYGSLYEKPCSASSDELLLAKSLNTDSIFLGHDHINNLSVLMDGIRVTYVTKTGRYDYHRDDMLGGTVSIISNNGNTIESEHIFSDK